MADPKIDDNEITKTTVREADKTSNAVPNDAEANDPPLRTNRPDVPIAQTLAAGAGAHEGRVLDREVDGVEVDKDGLDRDGRVVADPAKGSK
jgi:hypothetical protein